MWQTAEAAFRVTNPGGLEGCSIGYVFGMAAIGSHEGMTGATPDEGKNALPRDVGRTEPFDPVKVCHAFNQLQARHREVIRKAYCLGSTTRQIAAELNVGEAVVKSRLHYGLSALRLAMLENT